MTGYDPAGSWHLMPMPVPVPVAVAAPPVRPPAAAPFAPPGAARPAGSRPAVASPGATGPAAAPPEGAPAALPVTPPDPAPTADVPQTDSPASRGDAADTLPAGPDTADLTEADDVEVTVRPYARVGGRTHVPVGLGLSIEALVRGLAVAPRPDPAALTPEQRRVLDLTATSYQSVAELSAHLRLPIGVIRVVLADLLAAGLIQVYGRSTHDRHGVGLDILEGVLDGVSSL